MDTNISDVAVVGGGLAGLAAATWLAREGRRVTLFERAPAPGGRAVTMRNAGYSLNLGPHALYRGGPAEAALRELGVPFRGRSPAAAGLAVTGGVAHTLPASPWSLLSTTLLPLPAKLETLRFLAGLPLMNTKALHGKTFAAWAAGAFRQPAAAALVEALVRVSTYANAPDRVDAGDALAQLRRAALSGVLYLDGGWQTLVDGLTAAARNAGVRIVTGARVMAIEHDQQVQGVRLADGSNWQAGAVLVAASPGLARQLAPDVAVLADWDAAATPIRAACLDVALQRLPQPRARFALGIDRPLYLSVHSTTARLAPEGGAVIHVARYLAPGESGAEQELEGLLDLIQPGWREVVAERRYLPELIVSHALPEARTGGVAGRPGPAVPGVSGLYVAGDWVGSEGMLADAALGSARQAAALIAGAPARAAA